MSVVEVIQSSNQTHVRSRVPRVAIVGTGFVGSTTAYALLLSKTPAEIVLINRDKRRADGHVQDLRDAEVFSHTTRVVAGQFEDCCSADVIIITAGVSQSGQRSRLESLNETAAILKGLVLKVARCNPHGILLIASNPVDVLTYAAWKWSGLPPNRVIGSGTSLDTSRFRRRLWGGFGQRARICHRRTWREPGTRDFVGPDRRHVTGKLLQGTGLTPR
jgi:L-lactate dehydrogenase